MHRRSRQLVALVAALCFQAQALAAVLLPCAHKAVPPAFSAMHACHGGLADAGSGGDAGQLLDCEKCTLVTVLGACDLPTLELTPKKLGPLPALVLTEQDHFYRYAPDTPHRPPISFT